MEGEIKSLSTTKEVDELLLKKHKEEMERINEDYKRNKQETVNYLVNALLNVDLTVPDVVIGKFAAKVLGNN